jgi:hypothetical protein
MPARPHKPDHSNDPLDHSNDPAVCPELIFGPGWEEESRAEAARLTADPPPWLIKLLERARREEEEQARRDEEERERRSRKRGRPGPRPPGRPRS